MESSLSRRKEGDEAASAMRAKKDPSRKTFLSWWIEHDLDLYAGSLAFSSALLILSCYSLYSRKTGSDASPLHASAAVIVYQAQVAGATLLVLGSIFSLWMVRRSRFLSLNDSEKAKRRQILRFFRRIDLEDSNIADVSANFEVDHSSTVQLSGTSLSDIYHVYRRSSETGIASWTRITSLLLVEGDCVALQVGDVAPADCIMLDPLSGDQVIKVVAGEILSLESIGETSDTIMSHLPSSRATLPDDSHHLLTLCNGKRIFVVERTPIVDFIRQPPGESFL